MNKTLKTFLIIGGLMLIGSYGAIKYWPRGLRNNNPGNIRHNPANDWLGMVGQDEDGFVKFSDAKYGIRAMGKIIDSYKTRGVVMLRQIIETWAPPGENDTDDYLAHIQQKTGWQSYHVPVREEGDYLTMIKIMIEHENGRNPYSTQYIMEALEIA